MHVVVWFCVHLLFVCDTAVGNVVCCDGGCVCARAVLCRCACDIYVVCLLYVCARAVHVRRCIGRVFGDCGGAGDLRVWLHRAGITRRRWALVVCKCGGSCVCLRLVVRVVDAWCGLLVCTSAVCV